MLKQVTISKSSNNSSKLHAHQLAINLLLPWTTQKTPLQSPEEKLLARRFRNLDESSEAVATTVGMKEKKKTCGGTAVP
jgi:hypothetical protein